MNILSRLAAGSIWARLEWSVLAQVTGVILTAALLVRCIARRHAAARHGVWVGALVWVLLSPVIAAFVDGSGWTVWAVSLPLSPAARAQPPEPVPVGREVASQSTETVEPPRSSEIPLVKPVVPAQPLVVQNPPTGNRSKPRLVATERSRAVPAERPKAVRWDIVPGAVAIVWGVGVLIGLARIAFGHGRVVAMIRGARPLDPERHRDALAQVRAAFEGTELPPVLISDAAVGPLATGVRRPCVVLPAWLPDALTPSSLRDVLVHECAHVVRGDLWIGLLQRLTGALVWPHPLVHYLNGQLARAREEVCDNFVLRCGEPCGYSGTLLVLTELCRFPRPHRAGLGLLTARWTLTDRVAGILDPTRTTRTTATLRTRIIAACVLVATGIAMASVRLALPARADEPVRKVNGQAAGKPDAPSFNAWSIKGVVVDEQGRPVPGVSVRLPESARWARTVQGKTNADGSFTLADRTFRPIFAVVAEADDGSRAGLGRRDMTPNNVFQLNDSIRIVLKPTRPLTVRVKDASGAPIAGASVAAIDPRYQTAGSTGPDGLATLRVAADAQIRWVTGQKSGVGFDYFENYRTGRATEIPPLPGDVSLTLDGAQTIRVKAIDSKGRPLPGVQFAPDGLIKPGKLESVAIGSSPVSWVTTDAQGVAVFDWLPKTGPGCWFVLRSDEYSTPQDLDSRQQSDPTELTVRLLRATRLSGTVRRPNGEPARGIVVRAQGSGPKQASAGTRTGDDGTYALDVPPEKAYVVSIIDRDWAAPSRTGVVLREGQPQSGLDLSLTRGTLLHGQITEGPERKPSKGVIVALIEQGPVLPKEFRSDGSANVQSSQRRVADDQGRYEFRTAPGKYTLRVVGSREEVAVDVEIQSEIERDVALKTSTVKKEFHGIVVAKTQAGDVPISDAMVHSLTVGEYGATFSRTDERGRFRAVLRPSAVVYASGRGTDGPVAGFLPVPEGKDDVKVVVSPAAEVTGRVVDTLGNPLPRQFVSLQVDFGSIESESAHYRMRLTTDAQGRFKFPGLPVGTQGEVSVYHMKDGRPTGARTVASFQAPARERVEVTDIIVPASAAPKQ